MSAVPQKKLCWNCEGNVARDIDNCPYCAVYLHAQEEEASSSWNPSYHSSKTEEIPSPLYQIESEPEDTEEETSIDEEEYVFEWKGLFTQLKRDVFPIIFLMMGSVFFLFGIVLVLFSQNGTFTLQWKESHGFYFLLLAIPLIGFGWKFLQQLESND